MTDERKAVPREPTAEMIDAARGAPWSRGDSSTAIANIIWYAMYGAAPALATAPAEPPKDDSELAGDVAYLRAKNDPRLFDIANQLIYCWAQDGLLSKAQAERDKLQHELAETKRPLDDQMRRLNERVIALNDENLALKRDHPAPPKDGDVAALIEHGRKGYSLDLPDSHLLISLLTNALARLSAPIPDPIPMVLHCPQCSRQHIDAPQPKKEWTNPPHRSHECQFCGHVWRPADVATTGVQATQTHGSRDAVAWSYNTAPVPDTDVAQDDLREILRAVGLSDCARPYSPHEVVQRELLPHLRALRTVIEKYDGNSNNPYWAEEFNQAMRIARRRLNKTAAAPVPDKEK